MGDSLIQQYRVGEELWKRLEAAGELFCHDVGNWSLVTKKLTRGEAKSKYGPITDEEFGPRGGWKSITFGKKKFTSNYMRPVKKK